MSFIGRVFIIFLAFLLACVAAAMTIAFGLVSGEWHMLQADPVARAVFWIGSFVGASITGWATFAPFVLMVVAAEALRMRSVLFYALAGVAIALIAYYGWGYGNPYEESIDHDGPIARGIELVLAAGVVFGLTYWLIAGRRAGAWLDKPPVR